jgi:hypothetical protein
VAVLDLQPNWAISVAEPQDTDLDFTPLDPGGQPLLIKLQAKLPEGFDTGTDVLNVRLPSTRPASGPCNCPRWISPWPPRA